MKRGNWRIVLVVCLLVISGLSYCLQIGVFRRPSDTFLYMLQDFAFVPIQVLLVTLVINELMARREKSQLQHKMNMVIGAFFVELGNDLLRLFAKRDARVDELRRHVAVHPEWSGKDFAAAKRRIVEHTVLIDGGPDAFRDLNSLLSGRKDALLRLLENSNLLEHESFTEMLWAICHLTEELGYRADLDFLSDADTAHLEQDAQRAYIALTSEWISYVHHLKDQYPYMFSLVLRTDPFCPSVDAAVE